MAYEDLLERVRDVSSLLPAADALDARRVVDLARSLWCPPRGSEFSEANVRSAKLELQRLAEVLGRRGTNALPAAALARAVFADLSGDAKQAEALRRECETKLDMSGL